MSGPYFLGSSPLSVVFHRASILTCCFCALYLCTNSKAMLTPSGGLGGGVGDDFPSNFSLLGLGELECDEIMRSC